MNEILHLLGHLILVTLLGYYLILNLQWYNYRFKRIILHHHRPFEHIFLFLLPLFSYFALKELAILVAVIYALILFVWLKGVDKRLKFTPRVKRFFLALIFFTLFGDLLCLAKFGCEVLPTLLPLILASLFSALIEGLIFKGYKKSASKKLSRIDPIIVAITASYGKTSMKNFLHQILDTKFNCYMTPRSVNTLAGIVKDINDSLPKECEVYIVEAGARERGDIAEITELLNHHYAVVGKIGPQHIEYFKNIENIMATKLELLGSNRLKKAFLHYEIPVKKRENFIFFGDNIENLKADLNGIEFDLKVEGDTLPLKAPLLGAFNAVNLAAAVAVAKELGMENDEIVKAVSKLKGVEHRLQKIEAGGKIIIDDSFNGNLEGMLASYDLVKNYDGRKILVTPGIMESTPQDNMKLAEKIDEIFDLVIITSKTNRKVLYENIKRAKKMVLENKGDLENLLARETASGDLILFSNDAPSFM